MLKTGCMRKGKLKNLLHVRLQAELSWKLARKLLARVHLWRVQRSGYQISTHQHEEMGVSNCTSPHMPFTNWFLGKCSGKLTIKMIAVDNNGQSKRSVFARPPQSHTHDI